MTIYGTLLSRGYLPKELPPDFFSEQFSRYARTKQGRTNLASYRPGNNFTKPAPFRLALPGSQIRVLTIPHPKAYSDLAHVAAKHLRRLLKRSSASPFSRSRPVYSDRKARALMPQIKPSNLARERAIVRGASRFLLKADVSQFYPSLYTHAVGWAISPSLRKRENWRKPQLLGKKVDQALMDAQGKVSQGIPIGNDISYLLAELLLSRVDRELKLSKDRAYRWFDDYEIGCASRVEAEKIRHALEGALAAYNLRLNPAKTGILPLPKPVEDEWKTRIIERSRGSLTSSEDMVEFFDLAFSLREQFGGAPVLLYTMGVLFRLRAPTRMAGQIAVSAISQAILAEPGCSQKAFALLGFWSLNGLRLDRDLVCRTIERMISLHRPTDATSDVAWALSFCMEHSLSLPLGAGRQLTRFRQPIITLLALKAFDQGLLPQGFNIPQVKRVVQKGDLDGEDWLVKYEAARHGYVPEVIPEVKRHDLFSHMLSQKVTFLRKKLPSYAHIIQPGGAPRWVVDSWLVALRGVKQPQQVGPETETDPISLLNWMAADVERRAGISSSNIQAILDLLDVFEPEEFASLIAQDDTYSV